MADVPFRITGTQFEDGNTVNGLSAVSNDAADVVTAIENGLGLAANGAGGGTAFGSGGVVQAGLSLGWGLLGFGGTSPYSSGGGQTIRSANGGNANTVRSFAISGARFADGSVVSGSFSVAYDPETGAIASIDGKATVSGPSGTTTFSKPYVMSYADPNRDTGAYEITFSSSEGGSYTGLYLDWNGEQPTAFNSTSTFPYSSVHTTGGQPIRMVNGGHSSDLPCFAAGTLIATPHGETPVEALREGDRVVLAGGGFSTVRWVGSRRVQLDGHRRPELALPVRIAAGALADRVPMRDLLVSPDHALLLDGVLIPAKVLVNGSTVTQAPRGGDVTYVHVMLDAHAPLLANGAAAESYLDVGDHAGFGPRPGNEVVLHPAMAQRLRESWSFAPLRESGPVVERVRARLLERAGETLSDDPGLRVRLRDGFATIESRTAVPAEIGPCPEDRRVLGVKIAALSIDGASVPLDHPALSEGWHAVEPDGRWTNGAAVVPAALLRGGRVAVELAACLRYRVEAEAAPRASRNNERG